MNMAAYGFGPAQRAQMDRRRLRRHFRRSGAAGHRADHGRPDLPRGERRRRAGADPHAQPRGPLRRGARPLAGLRPAGLCHRLHRRDAGRQARRRQHRRQCRGASDAGRASRSRSARSPSRRSTSPTRSRRAARCSSRRRSAAWSIPATGSSIHARSRRRRPTCERFAQIGAEGIRRSRSICDSTNALKDGESPSEDEVAATLAALIAEAPYRVALTTFASNVGRVISIARAAEKAGRQVVMSGRALHRITGIARELGHARGRAAVPRPGRVQDPAAQQGRGALHRHRRASRAPRSRASRARSIRRSTSMPATA